MHDNADRAVVRVLIKGVKVGDLNHGQKRQQEQTQKCGQRQDALPCAALATKLV
jgi:hypothetical protein